MGALLSDDRSSQNQTRLILGRFPGPTGSGSSSLEAGEVLCVAVEQSPPSSGNNSVLEWRRTGGEGRSPHGPGGPGGCCKWRQEGAWAWLAS